MVNYATAIIAMREMIDLCLEYVMWSLTFYLYEFIDHRHRTFTRLIS